MSGKKSATQLFLKLHAQRWEQELFFKELKIVREPYVNP